MCWTHLQLIDLHKNYESYEATWKLLILLTTLDTDHLRLKSDQEKARNM